MIFYLIYDLFDDYIFMSSKGLEIDFLIAFLIDSS